MKKKPTPHEVVLSWAEVQAQHEGSVRLGPGFWQDKDGYLHVSIPELLDLAGLPHTEANAQLIIAYVTELVDPRTEVVILQHKES